MRVRRMFVRKGAKGQKFYRYDISIPARTFRALGWPDDVELTAEAFGDMLQLRPKKPKRERL